MISFSYYPWSPIPPPTLFEVIQSQWQSVIKWKFRGSLSYFNLHSTDVMAMDNLLYPSTFNLVKLWVSDIWLWLTFYFHSIFKSAKYLTSSMFSEAPGGHITNVKVKRFASWFRMLGVSSFYHYFLYRKM